MPELDFRTVSYRLWRLRRLILVSICLPLPGILFATLVDLGLGFGGGGGAIWLIWTLAVLALAIRFPNGWMDNIALGLPLLFVTFTSPIARIFDIGPFLGMILALIALVGGWLWINAALPAILEEIPLGDRKSTFLARVSLPASLLRDAVFLRPGGVHGLHACGPAEPDGLFEVKALGHQLPSASSGKTAPEVRFYAKVLEGDAKSQVTQFFLDKEDVAAGTVYEEITPTQRGCRYAKEEVHDHFSAFSALGFWLTDAEADDFTALLDHIQDKPARALKLMPQDSLLAWVTEQITERMSRDPA